MTFPIFVLTFLKALWLALKDETLLKLFGLTGIFSKNVFTFCFSFIDNEAYSMLNTFLSFVNSSRTTYGLLNYR